jgi:hypothetical protein
MPTLKITFDTSTLSDVVSPDLRSGPSDFDKLAANLTVHHALETGTIKGYFSEAVVALDLLGKDDKVEMVGKARTVSETSAAATRPAMFAISVGTRWSVPSLHEKSQILIQAAQKLGMKALIGPRHLGNSLPVRGFGDDFYENYASVADLLAGSAKTHLVQAAILKRGIGRWRVVELGLEYSRRDGVSDESWMRGIERARDDTERKKVRSAINEWADGEAVAAHAGYGNDLFCTNDHAKNAGQRSVFHSNHRAWLQRDYGVEFVTMLELAQRLEQLRGANAGGSHGVDALA